MALRSNPGTGDAILGRSPAAERERGDAENGASCAQTSRELDGGWLGKRAARV